MEQKSWRKVSASITLTVAMATPTLPTSEPMASATSLPACPSYSKWPTKPVEAGVSAAVKKYYVARHLAPATIYANRESVLNLKLERVGTHYCRNLDGSRAGYVGMVPPGATAAVIVHVKHKAYPMTGSASTFATLVKLPRVGWKLVSDDTGP